MIFEKTSIHCDFRKGGGKTKGEAPHGRGVFQASKPMTTLPTKDGGENAQSTKLQEKGEKEKRVKGVYKKKLFAKERNESVQRTPQTASPGGKEIGVPTRNLKDQEDLQKKTHEREKGRDRWKEGHAVSGTSHFVQGKKIHCGVSNSQSKRGKRRRRNEKIFGGQGWDSAL